MKELVVVLRTIICVMVIGYLLLVLVYLIPDRLLYKEVSDSAEILFAQGRYPSGYLDGWFLDNFTDADCISDTFNKNTNNPFYNALNAFQLGGENDQYAASVEALKSMIDGDVTKKLDHSYLWHGYRIWLRPLLIKYNITDIRYLCFVINIFLSVIVCIGLIEVTKNIWTFIPFLAAFTFFDFQMESLSLLFFNDIAIMLLGCIFIIYASRKEDAEKYFVEIFVGIGSIVAFSSMLIMPLLTIGFPLIVFLSLDKYNSTWKGKTIKTLKYSVCWFIGYAVTLFTKIILSALIINSGRGLKQVLHYMGKSDICTLKDRLVRISDVFLCVVTRSEMERDIVIIVITFLLIYIIVKRRNNLKKIGEFTPYFIVSIYPCIWCFVNVGHASHGWTYFNYSISIYALLYVIMSLCEFERNLHA